MKNRSEAAEDEEKDFPTTTTDLWEEYEREKAKLRKLDLTWSEYQERIAEIAERLGL